MMLQRLRAVHPSTGLEIIVNIEEEEYDYETHVSSGTIKGLRTMMTESGQPCVFTDGGEQYIYVMTSTGQHRLIVIGELT
jgi:hypothetical protein